MPSRVGYSLLLSLANGELGILEPWLSEWGACVVCAYHGPLEWRKKRVRLLLAFYFYHLLRKFLLCNFYNGHNT